MTYEVLVKKKQNHFTATVLGLPDCTVQAPTRAEAIRRARDAAATFVSEGEIVEIAPDSFPSGISHAFCAFSKRSPRRRQPGSSSRQAPPR